MLQYMSSQSIALAKKRVSDYVRYLAIKDSIMTIVFDSELIETISGDEKSLNKNQVARHQEILTDICLMKEDLPDLETLKDWHAYIMANDVNSHPGTIRTIPARSGGSNKLYPLLGEDRIAAIIDSLNRMMYNSQINMFVRLATLHHEFEEIHPFVDGNGRIGRLYLQWWAWELGIGLFHVHMGNKNEYIDCMKSNDIDRLANFIRQNIV